MVCTFLILVEKEQVWACSSTRCIFSETKLVVHQVVIIFGCRHFFSLVVVLIFVYRFQCRNPPFLYKYRATARLHRTLNSTDRSPLCEAHSFAVTVTQLELIANNPVSNDPFLLSVQTILPLSQRALILLGLQRLSRHATYENVWTGSPNEAISSSHWGQRFD